MEKITSAQKNVYKNRNPASPANFSHMGRVEHILFVNPRDIRGQLFSAPQEGMISVTAEALAINIEVNFYAILCALFDVLFNLLLTFFIYSLTLYVKLRNFTRVLLTDQHAQQENAPSRESTSFF